MCTSKLWIPITLPAFSAVACNMGSPQAEETQVCP